MEMSVVRIDLGAEGNTSTEVGTKIGNMACGVGSWEAILLEVNLNSSVLGGCIFATRMKEVSCGKAPCPWGWFHV